MYKIWIVNKQFSVCPTCHPQLQKNNGGRDNASIHGDDFVVSSLSCVRLFYDPVDCSQVPMPMGFPRQEYWSGLAFPSPGDLPNPVIEPTSPPLQVGSLPLNHQ